MTAVGMRAEGPNPCLAALVPDQGAVPKETDTEIDAEIGFDQREASLLLRCTGLVVDSLQRIA